MFLNQIFEAANRRVVVIYPGRFSPWHKGHAQVYKHLVGKYGFENVYIATSNKVEPPKSPFDFSDKLKMITLTGVDPSRVVQSTQPYIAKEITSQYNPETDVVIFAVSEKDMAEDPRFAFKPKKDGSPSYFQPLQDINQCEPISKHGYITTVPTFTFEVMGQPANSASQIRAMFQQSDEGTRKKIVKDLFGRYSDEVFAIMQNKLGAPVTENRFYRRNITTREDLIPAIHELREEMRLAGVEYNFKRNDVKMMCSKIWNQQTITESMDLSKSRKDFLTHFDSLDELQTINISPGNKISVISATMIGSDIEMWGYLTPKTITHVEYTDDGEIDHIIFNNDPNDRYPQTDLVNYNGEEVQHSIFFGDKQAASSALTMIMLQKPDDLQIRNYVTEAKEDGRAKIVSYKDRNGITKYEVLNADGVRVKGDLSKEMAREYLNAHRSELQESEQVNEISKDLAGNYIQGVIKQQLKKTGGKVKPDMLGNVEKDFGDKGPQRKKGVDRAYDRLLSDEQEVDETIRKVKGGYRLVSHTGKNLGTYPSKSGAEEREKQVNYFKHQNEAVDPAVKAEKKIASLQKKYDTLRGRCDMAKDRRRMKGQRLLSQAEMKYQRQMSEIQQEIHLLKVNMKKEPVTESYMSAEELSNIIADRIDMRYPQLITDYGIDVVGNAIMDVADFYAGDIEELGSSDIGGMVREVIKQLKANSNLDEDVDSQQIDIRTTRGRAIGAIGPNTDGTWWSNFYPNDSRYDHMSKEDAYDEIADAWKEWVHMGRAKTPGLRPLEQVNEISSELASKAGLTEMDIVLMGSPKRKGARAGRIAAETGEEQECPYGEGTSSYRLWMEAYIDHKNDNSNPEKVKESTRSKDPSGFMRNTHTGRLEMPGEHTSKKTPRKGTVAWERKQREREEYLKRFSKDPHGVKTPADEKVAGPSGTSSIGMRADLGESAAKYTARETKDGVWRVFKQGESVSVAGPFDSADEAGQWIKDNGSVNEAKSISKHVKIVAGPAKGKTGWIGEVRHGAFKGAPKEYTIDLEDGGNIRCSAQQLRLIKDEQVNEGWKSKAAAVATAASLAATPASGIVVNALRPIDSRGNTVADPYRHPAPKAKKEVKIDAMTGAAPVVKPPKKVKESADQQKTFKVVFYSPKTDRNVTKNIKANNESEIWDKLQLKGVDIISVTEQGVAEASDYFRRRQREEDIISGKKPARKKAPAQTSDYTKRREKEKKNESIMRSVTESVGNNAANKLIESMMASARNGDMKKVAEHIEKLEAYLDYPVINYIEKAIEVAKRNADK